MLALNQLSNYLTLKGSFSVVSKPHLQVNTRWKALDQIYKMHSFETLWNRIPTTRKTVGRKEPGPDNHGKNDQEKLIRSRSALYSILPRER